MNLELRMIKGKKTITNCGKIRKVKVYVKNRTVAHETARVIHHKDGAEAYIWSNVKLKGRQAKKLTLSYDPSGDKGHSVTWTAEIIIDNDAYPADNSAEPRQTEVTCGP